MIKLKKELAAKSRVTGPLLLLLMLVSCTTLTEDKRTDKKYDREDELILAREKFEREQRKCRESGGSMVLTRYSASKINKPTASDYRLARCIWGRALPQ